MQHAYPRQLVTDFFKAKAAAYVSPMGVKVILDQETKDVVLVDVRLPSPQLKWRIPGSLTIPAAAIGERFRELPKDKLIVLYCGHVVQPCDHRGAGTPGAGLSCEGDVRRCGRVADASSAATGGDQ